MHGRRQLDLLVDLHALVGLPKHPAEDDRSPGLLGDANELGPVAQVERQGGELHFDFVGGLAGRTHEIEGRAWMGSSHEAWMMICWAIYAGLVASRFAGRHAGRQAAASAVAAFCFLLFAVLGIGVFA